jgi:hypothetical protein
MCRALRGLQARRVDVEVEVVVAAGVGPGFEPMRSPQGRDLGAGGGDTGLGKQRPERVRDVGDIEDAGHDRPGELGRVAHNEIRRPGLGRR